MVKLQKDVQIIIFYLISFFLLLEWLQPLHLLTDTKITSVFAIFIGFSFVLSYFRVRFYLTIIFKIFYILLIYHTLYLQGGFLSLAWFTHFWEMIQLNVTFILHSQWFEVTGGFRTLLFFIFLWLITYLMHYWLIVQRQILFFVFLTIVYVGILDTFTPFDGKMAIIRTVFISFLLLSVLHFSKVKKDLKIDDMKNKRITLKWIIPVIFLLVSSTTIAYFAPKAEPFWPDPIPYLKSLVDGSRNGNGGIQKVGYGTNDSTLGGPFIQDDMTVFFAEANKKHYWRIETKDYYTGKGWEVSNHGLDIEMGNENTYLHWYEENVERTPLNANLNFQGKHNHIVYPMGLNFIVADPSIHYWLNLNTEKITSVNSQNEPIKLDSYSLIYQYPSYSINELESATEPGGLEEDRDFKQMYTQLPEALPLRVRELANEIVEGKENRYAKVRAIENFFSVNGFKYETKNVAVPVEEEDYVDQFLFDTKKGYCDNFSTSMVVLLRAAGIPARWVKGYTSGEYVESIDGTRNKYEITNNNAHSWVEVYFPHSGWVTFEPTIGFSSSVEFTYESSETEQPSLPEAKPIEKPKKPDMEINENKHIQKLNILEKLFSFISWKKILGVFIVFSIIVLVIFKTKRKWKPILTIHLYKHRKDEQVYFLAYLALIDQLRANGIKKKDGQTLREFAAYVDKYYQTNSMKELTLSYERALYRRDKASLEWQKSVELWENLIKMSSS